MAVSLHGEGAGFELRPGMMKVLGTRIRPLEAAHYRLIMSVHAPLNCDGLEKSTLRQRLSTTRTLSRTSFQWCRGWCELLCGRGCGFCVGPLKRYQEAFSAGRYIPTLQVSNYMNREAIVQVRLPLEACSVIQKSAPLSLRVWEV